MTNRLQDRYRQEIRPALTKEFGYTNPMDVPRLSKIVINMGVGEALSDSKKIDAAAKELTLITGQKAMGIASRKAIATFKLR